MVATRIVATPDVARAKAAHRGSNLGVALFNQGTSTLPGLGWNLRDQVARDLPTAPSALAWDFLSIALAVFAADRFVLRSETDDGWTRVMALDVAVQDPAKWQPHGDRLASALRFLTGDIWTLSFSAGGQKPPNFPARLNDRDTVCLFSGGLDSLLGALHLQHQGKRPLLVSQGSTKEIGPQDNLARKIRLNGFRFDGRVNEHWRVPYEGSTRARSIIFFAYGALAASAIGKNEVIVPENGLIAINPPLTPRRLGSLSTRTTHPHFLSELGAVLTNVGLNMTFTNIFEGKSKGEMLAECVHPDAANLAAISYSCGKGKRRNGQCGRCVPCLIRRASFNAAGLADATNYFDDIEWSAKYDDVIAARIAVARKAGQTPVEFDRWLAMSGPLPSDPARRAAISHAVEKGLEEVGSYLAGVRWR